MIEKIKAKIDYKLLKQCFIYTYVLGLIAHAFVFMNITISHDSLDEFYSAEQWAKANLGRFFYPVYITFTRGRIVIPWLIGVLALCWIALAVYIIIRVFRIEKTEFVLLVSGICVTNPTVYALAATYIHDFDADMFSMLLAVVSAYFWKDALKQSKIRLRCLRLFIGAIILSISLGIYQSYVSVTITLIIFICMQSLWNEKNPKEIFYQGILGIIMLVISAGLYLIETKTFSCIIGYSILKRDSYNGLGNIAQVFSGDIIGKITGTYTSLFTAFKNLVLTAYPAKIFWTVLVLLLLCIVAMILINMKKMQWKGRILLILLIVIMPFGMNLSYFLSAGSVHVLMQYAAWFVLILAVILISDVIKKCEISVKVVKLAHCFVVLVVLLIVAENIQTANTIYVKKELEYESTLAYMTRVAERMEEQEGYIPGETPVLFIGKNIGETREGFERYNVITGAQISGPITYYDTYVAYFEYVLGRPVISIENEELKYSSEVYTMPSFPAMGSVQMIEGTLVVKMK